MDLSQLRLNIFAEIVDRIGVSWDVWYGRLKAYKDREGHCLVPANHRENGCRLGQWVEVQRQYKKDDALSGERRRRLDELGFVWNARDAAWEEGFSYLMRYKNRIGHCVVPYGYVESEFKLGFWVANQRAKADLMPLVRRQQLDGIGFVWEPFENAWDQAVNYLKAFREREGHCRVPKDHKEDGFPLGQWVVKRRAKGNAFSGSPETVRRS